MGIAAALERGRRACVHPYIARMDVDDLTLPGRLEAQIEVMGREPLAGAVGGRALLFQDEEHKTPKDSVARQRSEEASKSRHGLQRPTSGTFSNVN